MLQLANTWDFEMITARKAVVITNESLPHHASFGGSFAAGLRARGWQVEASTSYKPAALVVMWGVRNRVAIAQQRAAGGEVCILERGYLGDRFAMTSVSFGGGLNGRGRFVTPLDNFPSFKSYDGQRFTDCGFDLQPWVANPNGYALIMGQVAGDQSIKGVNIEAWYYETAAKLRAVGWPVLFRPHPGSRVKGQPQIRMGHHVGSLADALDGAGLVVTWNSNSAVDAVLAGRPTVAMDEGSMAREVAAHDIAVVTPDRGPWAARLAWCQYSRAEMESGFCQEAVGL